jgi:hypothetical protein
MEHEQSENGPSALAWRSAMILRSRIAADACESACVRATVEEAYARRDDPEIGLLLRRAWQDEIRLRALAERVEAMCRRPDEEAAVHRGLFRELGRRRLERRRWLDRLPRVAGLHSTNARADLFTRLAFLPMRRLRVLACFGGSRRRPSVKSALADRIAGRLLDPDALLFLVDGLIPDEARLLERVANEKRVVVPSADAQSVKSLHDRGLVFSRSVASGLEIDVPDDLAAAVLEALAERWRREASRPPFPAEDAVPDPWRPEGFPTPRARWKLAAPGPERVLEIEARLLYEGRNVRRVLRISSRRSLGALHQALQIAFRWSDRGRHAFERDTPRRVWLDLEGHGTLTCSCREEWTTPLRDVLGRVGATLTYSHQAGGAGCRTMLHALTVLAVHAPEHVEAEPTLVAFEGTWPPTDNDRSDAVWLRFDQEQANRRLRRMA